MRMMHEASLHDDNVFLTLTYDDVHLPPRGSLVKRHFQDFIRRLRKRHTERISYFHCGEYGDQGGRPHYHAILFGVDFADREPWATSGAGHAQFTSPFLSTMWEHGLATFGSVTFESAGYCARYCLKKVNGDRAEEHYRRVDPESGEVYWLTPEYATMSLKPGIGKRWFEKYGNEVANYDGCVVNGRMTGSPRYYDKLRGKAVMKPVKRERVFAALEHASDNTDKRLAVRRKVKEAALRSLKRSL